MKAILQYVQKVIASNKDGTINMVIDTGEIATLTVKNRSIVAASLDDHTGKEALETIKLATIKHMEFWAGITQKSDIHKMIAIQAETNALSPLPEEEMHPEGAPIELDDDENDTPDADMDMDSDSDSDMESDQLSSEIKQEPEETPHLTEKEADILSGILTDYIGPAANIVVESCIEQARDMDHLIKLLAEELFSDQERDEFSQKAYFLLNQI